MELLLVQHEARSGYLVVSLQKESAEEMRTYTARGQLVTLLHFRFCVNHVNLLVRLQHEVPNLILQARNSKGMPVAVKAFEIRLERDLLTILNPQS